MEQLPPRPPDEGPHGHQGERLWPGEIDLTGATRQDHELADVIGDAISEAETGGDELPEWGARSLARALANERTDPFDGALHHFAVTGRADPEAMARELADLYEADDDMQIREWINWLGTYVIRLPDEPAGRPTAGDQDTELADAPSIGKSPEEFKATMQRAFAEADARGEAITDNDAQSLAMLLSLFLNTGSEMAQFADTGDANPVLLSQECQTVRRLTEHVPGADQWVTRFEQHLASRSDLGRQPGSTEHVRPEQPAPDPSQPTAEPQTELPDNPNIQEGISEHGDAFRAYLHLSDVDPSSTELQRSFDNCYVGAFDSMDALVRDLTDGMTGEGEDAEWIAAGATLEELVRSCWDIVEMNGTFYVFSK